MKTLLVIVVVLALAASMMPVDVAETVYLKIGCLGEPRTLNIWAAADVWSHHVVRWFYPSLYYRKPVTLEPLPDVCMIPLDEVQNKSPNGLTFTFPLRQDVRWDDGTPVTAYDFECAYDIIAELELEDYLSIYEDVKYIRAVDDFTLEIKLRKCTPQFEESLIYHFAVPRQQFEPMLESALKELSPAAAFLGMDVRKPVSAGPFSFAVWREGFYVKLVTNPDYHGKGREITVKGVGTITEGPFYDGLYLKIYINPDDALEDIEDGKIDYIWWNLGKENADELQKTNIAIEKTNDLGFFYLAPNTVKEPFDDVVLRQALVHLVDKEYIVNTLLQEYGGVAHSVVTPAAGDWYNGDVNTFGSGMSRKERIKVTKELLTAGGYTVPDSEYPDSVIELPNGSEMEPFEILTLSEGYDPVMAGAGVLIEEWWREIGVPVTVRHISLSEITKETFETQTFDWFILGWKIDGTQYPDHLRYFHSDQAVHGGNNPMGYKNAAVDKYLEGLMTLCDRKELVTAAWKAQETIVEDVACCPLYYRTKNEAHRTDTFTGWFTQVGGISGSESPQSCLLYVLPTAFLHPPSPSTPPPSTPPPTISPPTKPPHPPTKPPPGGSCSGTVLVVLFVVGATFVNLRRKN